MLYWAFLAIPWSRMEFGSLALRYVLSFMKNPRRFVSRRSQFSLVNGLISYVEPIQESNVGSR